LAGRHDVLSELLRPKPERNVLAFVAAQPLDLLIAVTLVEFGLTLSSWSGA